MYRDSRFVIFRKVVPKIAQPRSRQIIAFVLRRKLQCRKPLVRRNYKLKRCPRVPDEV